MVSGGHRPRSGQPVGVGPLVLSAEAGPELRFAAVIGLLLCLEIAEVVIQAVEPLLPESAVALHPISYLFQAPRLDPAGPPLRLPASRDQPRSLQHLQVTRDGGSGDVEPVRYRTGGELSVLQFLEDLAAGRNSQSAEGASGVLHSFAI